MNPSAQQVSHPRRAAGERQQQRGSMPRFEARELMLCTQTSRSKRLSWEGRHQDGYGLVPAPLPHAMPGSCAHRRASSTRVCCVLTRKILLQRCAAPAGERIAVSLTCCCGAREGAARSAAKGAGSADAADPARPCCVAHPPPPWAQIPISQGVRNRACERALVWVGTRVPPVRAPPIGPHMVIKCASSSHTAQTNSHPTQRRSTPAGQLTAPGSRGCATGACGCLGTTHRCGHQPWPGHSQAGDTCAPPPATGVPRRRRAAFLTLQRGVCVAPVAEGIGR